MISDLIVGMAGSGGDGVVSAGESLLTAASAVGFHAIMTKSFGPQIRGGESSCCVRLSTERIYNTGDALDVAVALNWDDFLKFGAELTLAPETVLIYETKSGAPPEKLTQSKSVPKQIIDAPIADMAKQAAGTEKAKTSVVLGLLSGWFGIPREAFSRGLQKKFAKKGQELVDANERALTAGVEFARAHPLKAAPMLAVPEKASPKLLCDGNDMSAAGALFAGCKFFGGYPITPSTEVMQNLAGEIWKYGGAVLQAEDEIAGIGAALGASFAGVKSMTATSGPGMSLKTEVMGLATVVEMPLVILNVQRGGPSTGIPTKPEQGDLFQAVFSAHGDVMRPVLAPTCVADSFTTTIEAFNLAEHYQTPVIILSDQEIAQRKETIDPIDTSKIKVEDRLEPTAAELENYQRFRRTESCISPVSHPGIKGGAYLGAGIEHTERGDPSANGEVHLRMMDKRFHKFDTLKQRADLFDIYGDAGAPMALVSWGSSAGVAREALDLVRQKGLKAKLLVPRLLYPIAEGIYNDFFKGVRAGLVVEQSYQGQLYRLLRMFLDVPRGVRSFSRAGANPFRPSEVVEQIMKLEAEAKHGQ